MVQIEEGEMVSERLECLFAEVSAREEGMVEHAVIELVRVVRGGRKEVETQVVEKERQEREKKGFWRVAG